MIVPMRKVYIVARRADRDRLLESLRHLGLVHLQAVDAARAVADDETVAAIDRLRRALQILENKNAAGEPLALSPAAAADEVLRIQRESVERSNRLSSLYHQLEQLALWGDLRLSQLADLRAADIEPKFFAVPRNKVGEIRADCVQPLGPWPGKRTLVAVINRPGEVEPPEGSEAIPLPSRDRPGIRGEAAEIDAALKADVARLARLVHHMGAIEAESAKLRERAAWTVATRSSLDSEHLYALRGWVPADQADRLAPDLAAQGVEAAVEARDPEPGEEPPTLIKYPWWARPMEGLFKILGTVPGYAEFDVSAMFMIFLPVFSAILISDAGYGLLYLVLPIIFYRKLASMGAAPLAQLIMVIGVLSLIWGIVTCSFFGFDISALFGRQAPFLTVNMTKESMDFLMFLSILLGAIHLCLAHLWKAKANFPHPRFVGNLGWAIWFWGIYGLVSMFLLKTGFSESTMPPYPWFLLVGGSLAVLFAGPGYDLKSLAGMRRFVGNAGWAVALWGLYALIWHGLFLGGKVSEDHPFMHTVWMYYLIVGGAAALILAPPGGRQLKEIGLGLANFPLSAIGTFGDTVSYVRLMAIGLAGCALAGAFNDMGGRLPWFGMIPVVMAGHAMNVSLSIISLFAHGVRLNMLEFSNNLGMQWSGYSYEPFSSRHGQEN
jgi:V/A-type H+-transporting ATPase subunit I